MPLPPIQAASLPPPIRTEPEMVWPVTVRGEAQRDGEEAVRRPVASTRNEQVAEDRRERQEREMLGRLRVALAESETRPANVMRRGSYGLAIRTPAGQLEQRIGALLGNNGGDSLRRLDERV
jgi:hypothetical protein